jgi:hypothetical protein
MSCTMFDSPADSIAAGLVTFAALIFISLACIPRRHRDRRISGEEDDD